MHDRSTHELMCVERAALAEHPCRDQVQLHHDPREGTIQHKTRLIQTNGRRTALS